jgi:hypothetical protein
MSKSDGKYDGKSKSKLYKFQTTVKLADTGKVSKELNFRIWFKVFALIFIFLYIWKWA